MGRVRIITKDQLNEVKNTDAWWKDYDTIYYQQESEDRDEFCVKNPKQIEQMIMLMNDQRLYDYGLHEEFKRTRWRCI